MDFTEFNPFLLHNSDKNNVLQYKFIYFIDITFYLEDTLT